MISLVRLAFAASLSWRVFCCGLGRRSRNKRHSIVPFIVPFERVAFVQGGKLGEKFIVAHGFFVGLCDKKPRERRGGSCVSR